MVQILSCTYSNAIVALFNFNSCYQIGKAKVCLFNLTVFKMKQKANSFNFRVLLLKPYPNWDQIGIPFTYVKKVGLLLKLPLPVKALKLGIRLPVIEGEVLQ